MDSADIIHVRTTALFLLYLFLCKRYNKHKIIKGRGAMNTEKSILIRTDGNQDIAAGHLMRCLSIAQALHEKKCLSFLQQLMRQARACSGLFSDRVKIIPFLFFILTTGSRIRKRILLFLCFPSSISAVF